MVRGRVTRVMIFMGFLRLRVDELLRWCLELLLRMFKVLHSAPVSAMRVVHVSVAE